MEKFTKAHRQGDVLLLDVTEYVLKGKARGYGAGFIKDDGIWKTALQRASRGVIIKEGEQTGHKHELTGDAVLLDRPGDWNLDMPEGDFLIVAKATAKVRHNEHNPLVKIHGSEKKEKYFIARSLREYDETMGDVNVGD